MVVLFIQILNKKKKDDAAFSLRTSKKVSYLLFAGQKYQRHRTYEWLYKKTVDMGMLSK